MKRISLVLWLGLGFVIALQAGCGVANHQRLLQKHVERYNQQLRWDLLDNAQGFVSAEYLKAWRSSHLESKRNLKIVSIEPRLIKVTEAKPISAFFATKITWYLESNMTVRQSMWNQEWRSEKNQWRLVKEAKMKGNGAQWP